MSLRGRVTALACALLAGALAASAGLGAVGTELPWALRLGGSAGLFVLGAALAHLLAGRALAPLRAAAQAAANAESAEEPPPLTAGDPELSRLLESIQAARARLAQSSSREHAFLTTASHELRRPLSALTGELELALRQDRPAAELRESIELALDDARAMARLVDDLLLHARAMARGIELREEAVDLLELADRALPRAQRFVPQGTRIRLGTFEPLVLRGDPRLLGMVVENLLVNAGTHGGEGVRVQLQARVREGRPQLVVEDDGAGIPPAERARIFEPFGRGDETRSASGAGLGLAIVRDVAASHGGRVEVESPIAGERGTRFTVSFPPWRLESADAGA